jgi:IS5 family transposase
LALLQESLANAARTGALKPSDLSRVVVDTTVQEKAVTFPTNAKLIHRARERLVRQAKRCGVKLRQSYVRVGKLALIQHQRYAHAHQFKRDFKRRAAIEPVIGHLKSDHRMGRNYLAHSSGDAINAVLASVGYNFRRLIQWLRLLMFRILIALGMPGPVCVI